MKALIVRLLVFVASGYVLMFFSEYYFTNEEPAFSLIAALTSDFPNLLFLLEFVLLYTFFSYAMLIAIDRFQIKNLFGLILAGALFGWWTEGVVIPVIYEAIPITIFWPSIGWHVMVDVLIGWYLFRKLLHMNKWYLTIVVTMFMGFFWGVWATWFWSDGYAKIEPNDFVIYTFFTSFILMIAYIVMDQFRFKSLHISKLEMIVFGVVSIGFLSLLSISYGIMIFLVMFPLVGLTLFALHKGSKKEKPVNLFLDGATKWWQYPIVMMIPITASTTYYFVFSNGKATILGELLPPLLMIVGFVVFFVALYKNFNPSKRIKGTENE